MRDHPTFAENLRAQLRAHKIMQSELARRIRVEPSTITRYVTGERMPSGPELVAIARVLAIEPEALLGSNAISVAPAEPPPPRGRPRRKPSGETPAVTASPTERRRRAG